MSKEVDNIALRHIEGVPKRAFKAMMQAKRTKATSRRRDIEFGPRVRQLRSEMNLTLQQVSDASGLAISTLSKIENSQNSPTYDNLIRLADGLGVDVSFLFSNPAPRQHSGRKSVTRKSSGPHINNENYDYELLCSDLSQKRFLSVKATLKCHDITRFGELYSHEGEEFIYVLSGSVKVFTDAYEPFILSEGDSSHFDSRMAHACISQSERDAVVLWCYAREYPHDSEPAQDAVIDRINRPSARLRNG
ncbi:XRE family transcriptional regulator [Bosea vestrisii]|uniref:helix-turn-helix domain-containing protein n=1 Tax=Bosea vestrisii TaxID=151416 RepID=UPI0024DFE323|nr:XRE family transcriptional regulator [Bosea vestrisii]WID95197.1 XRE family transcriptional regulator [Bosea vestrisii]